jgi:RND superfamily putative drug exporter
VLPFVPLIQIGFTVAFGVLLDALLVRSLLVPALALDLDRRIWWPSRLARPSTAGAHEGGWDLGSTPDRRPRESS